MPDPKVALVRVTLDDIYRRHQRGEKFAMLTAYDYPTAAAAQAAEVPMLLVGDTAGAVVLGQGTTREVTLAYMLTITDAVRRGAPQCCVVADMPFLAMSAGADAVVRAGQAFCHEIGCDAVKVEVRREDLDLVAQLVAADVPVIAHLGLRPQSVTDPSGYRVHAKQPEEIAALVADAQAFEQCGARLLLLEAVPPEASEAVVSAVAVPVIGCGAGPACAGHVVVTHDLLGIGRMRPPKFVPVLESLTDRTEQAMRQWVSDIATGRYPADEHLYRAKPSPTHGAGSR